MIKIKVFINLFIIALFAWSLPVQATPVNFNFLGTVSYSDGSLSGVNVGSSFIGSFSYDTSTSANFDTGWIAHYSLGAASFITANIGSHAVTANNLVTDIYNDTGGNVEDEVSLGGGYPVIVDGTAYNNGYFGFNLASKPGNTGALASTALPGHYNLSVFDGLSSLNYGVLQRDGGQTGRILEFSMQAITNPVPEPESYAMLLCGLGLIGFAARRK